ncbi:hypothetical protein U3516DRAFT_379021 [Neocallimastix sp. 'constans']|jgi:hypothetical protein
MNISEIYAEEETITGYFFDIFKNKENRDYTIRNIISYYNDNKENIIGKNNYNLNIVFSQSEKYEDYVYEVKKEINDSKYQFFLIDYKTLFDDFTYYKNINEGKDYLVNELNRIENKASLNDTQNMQNILSEEIGSSDNYFYLNTIPINEDIIHNTYINNFKLIFDDYKLNDHYYALPFSSSYNFLIYNNKLLKGLNQKISENPSWSDIQMITDEYNKNNPGSNKYGISLALKNEEDFTSFLLEFMFDYSKIKYTKCIEFKKNKKLPNNIINKYFSYSECAENGYDIFFSESGMGDNFRKIKDLMKKNYIHPESLELDENQAVEKFLNGESIFLRGSYDIFKLFSNLNLENNTSNSNLDKSTIYSTLNLNNNSNSNNNKITNNNANNNNANNNNANNNNANNSFNKSNNANGNINTNINNVNKGSNAIQKRDDIIKTGNTTFYGNNYNYGISILPSGFSTYKGYSLVGNNHRKFQNMHKAIIDVMTVLTTEQAQIKRAHDYNILPAFDYSTFATIQNNVVCDKIPCHTYLNNIKTISLTKTLFNTESISNKNIRRGLKNNFIKFLNISSVGEADSTYLSNFILKVLKYDLSMEYVHWSSILSLVSIGYFVFGNLYALILIIAFIIQKRKNKTVIEHVSATHGILYIFGLTSFFNISLLDPGFPTKITCILSHNLTYLLLSIALCCYFVKVWKINVIVNNLKFRILGIKFKENSYTLINVVFLTLIIGLNILWDFLSPRETAIKSVILNKEEEFKSSFYRMPVCYSKDDNLYNGIIVVLIFIYFIITFILTYLSRKAVDYYDEYKSFMYSMTIIFISFIGVFIFKKMFNKYDFIFIADHTLGFICGITLLSLTVLPKLIESFTGKSFKKNFRKSNDITEMSIENLIGDGNFKVISFKNPESEHNSSTNYLSEEAYLSSTNSSMSRNRNNINNDNNLENQDINDIPIKPLPFTRYSIGTSSRRSTHSTTNKNFSNFVGFK